MPFLRSIFILFVLGATSSSLLFANENVQELEQLEGVIETPHLNQTVAYARKQNKQDSGKTYVRCPSTKSFQSSKSVFFQTNIGVGFLYFSGLRGNLMGRPVGNFLFVGAFRDAPLKGHLSYNRSPLFEFMLGYRLNSWLKLALSYQHQSGMVIQSKVLSAFPDSAVSLTSVFQFSSNLSLDGLLAKVYLELPYAMIWKNLSVNPYLAAGVGPGWQSWSQIQVESMFGTSGLDPNGFSGNILPLRQKISANAVWMIDMGLQIQRASPANPFSLVMGCKYNQWGQARSIGKMSQQGTHKLALNHPLRIKTVYQFAPYLGVQWNFAPAPSSAGSYKLKGKSPQVWLPYFVSSKEFQCSQSVWTQFNAGIGFLYFSGLKGNLMGRPVGNFSPATFWRDAPIKGRLSYNRTPLMEYLLGYRFNTWLKLALSYQHQGGIAIQTKAVSAYETPTANTGSFVVQLTSNLTLDALLAKAYFELPFAMIWRSLSINPYLAVGVGPGWQSWTYIQSNYMGGIILFINRTLPLRQKISANAVWMADIGLRLQSAYPNNQFSVQLGCKYNQWGQARSIGKMSQQGQNKRSLTQPLRIKTVYQFAPYLGVQWNFAPDQSMGQSYKLKGKSPKVCLPYWVASREFQCPTNIWTQFNAGIGLLYFSGVRGNLMGQPAILFTSTTVAAPDPRDIPLKGRLTYNRTPLFEYLVGYKFNPWLKVALSYQYQGGITIGTKALRGYPPGASVTNNGQYAQLTSNFSLNAILAKVYFELPFSMIWRSLSTNPYLALGVGPGWQSWTKTQVTYMHGNTAFLGEPVPLSQKISANVVWMVDVGMRIQSAYPNSKFSVLLGCKYNQWGQARSIGKMSQQGAHKVALGHPLIIKTIYQFAPYLGVQWNF